MQCLLEALLGGFIAWAFAEVFFSKKHPNSPKKAFKVVFIFLAIVGLGDKYIFNGLLSQATPILFTIAMFYGLVKMYQGTEQKITLNKIKKAGKEGEKEVAYSLDWLDNDYVKFHGVKLKNSQGFVQEFDHLVIGKNGIFNIETKALSGKIIINEYGHWSRIKKNGLEENVKNPLGQVLRHEKVLRDILDNNNFEICNLIVLAHQSCIVEGIKNSQVNIEKPDTLQFFIENYQPKRMLTDNEVQEVKSAIKKVIVKDKSPKNGFGWIKELKNPAKLKSWIKN